MVGGAVGTCVHGVVLDCVGAWMSVDDLWMTVANVAGYVLSYAFSFYTAPVCGCKRNFLNYIPKRVKLTYATSFFKQP